MRRGNCILEFQGNNYPNRKKLLFGILKGGYSIPVHSDCSKPRYIDNSVHNRFQKSNTVLPKKENHNPINQKKRSEISMRELPLWNHEQEYEYVPGLLSEAGLKFYVLSTSYKCEGIIFPKSKIFIPDITNKHILHCWIELVEKQKMIQRRQLFTRQNTIRGQYRPNYRLPYNMRLTSVIDLKTSYYKDRGLQYQRQQEVVQYPFIERIPLTNLSVSLLVQWLLAGGFNEHEIHTALIDKFGEEIISLTIC